ncbi:MAG: DUF4197 domain-containing protein [Gemmatimonadetes bacterium]|nr:DUF4197 domain-containing protein [Gemmatimonadota bacterium]
MRIGLILLCIAAIGLGAGCTSTEIAQTLETITGGSEEGTVAAGLKEALRVGTSRTVTRTNVEDGYFGNPLIRIGLPSDLDKVASALRTIGLGSNVDELELAMNRAAEKAAGEATDVFVSAITKMTLQDALGILNGNETAATDYFYGKTSDELRERFHPIIVEKMGEVGVYNAYDRAVKAYEALPLVSKPSLDLEGYVTERSLNGLFTVLGEEEKRIREDPAARTTDLLREVFGSRAG